MGVPPGARPEPITGPGHAKESLHQMSKPGVLILTALPFIAHSLSCSTGGPSTLDFELAEISTRLGSAADGCIGADIPALPCRELEPDADYTPDDSKAQFGAALVDGVRESRVGPSLAAASVITVVVGGASFVLDELDFAEEFHARGEVRRIASAIDRRIREGRFDRCHAMCLIQCFTSRALVYDSDQGDLEYYAGSRADGGPYAAAAEGRGICRNYVSLGVEIGSLIDEDLRSVLTDDWAHRVIGYDDGGRNYLIEPQRDPVAKGNCDRYPVR